MNYRPYNHTNSQKGFTLLECIIVAVLIGATVSWTVPNIRRHLIRQSVNNYVLRIEAGLQSLRMKQAVMKTSCVMQFPPEAINQEFRFLDTEQGPGTEDVELSFTRSQFTISPPGTSDDGGSLVILIRAKAHALLKPSLPIRCVEFTGNGLSRVGDWENARCETR